VRPPSPPSQQAGIGAADPALLLGLIQAALALERGFVATLRALVDDFRAPLRASPPAGVAADDIEAFFTGVDELLAAAPPLLATLEGVVAARRVTWLAPFYAKSPGYLEAYRCVDRFFLLL